MDDQNEAKLSQIPLPSDLFPYLDLSDVIGKSGGISDARRLAVAS